ncbi:class I SAM-dependent methyltransferase [Paenibacillus albiflavus]|uniref:Class I SAM-dependent methyltransferase n=1 Tax=Paenibacillus albiflavus TaxID=2545760 RepID=A0A4R4EKR7_9BACL|nr:class I SAM-dependent methyltransferase [Paenibacillus albiflavus]TCZ80816.1 class I SAM-dependent methyltransferase [Paenibacillus albiflavus]
MNINENNPPLQISQLYGFIDQVDGWLTGYEQSALLHLPALVDHLDGEIIEIGSFKGKSTAALGLGSKWISNQKRSIYAIDPFIPSTEYGEYYNDFQKNILGFQLENYVVIIKKYSHEALLECPKRISALFIDGNHNYLDVKRDIELYSPRVVAGGMIAFHDYNVYHGVQRAVDELCVSKEYVYVCDYDSLRLIRKLN